MISDQSVSVSKCKSVSDFCIAFFVVEKKSQLGKTRRELAGKHQSHHVVVWDTFRRVSLVQTIKNKSIVYHSCHHIQIGTPTRSNERNLQKLSKVLQS